MRASAAIASAWRGRNAGIAAIASARASTPTCALLVRRVATATTALQSLTLHRAATSVAAVAPRCIGRAASTSSTATAAGATASAGKVIITADGPAAPLAARAVRNIAVIAHVDHGKTSLVDRLLRFTDSTITESMDSNPLEKERGITILAKCTSLAYNGIAYNVVDTPGHADFGGEVERCLNMVDGVLLVVDAQEGPMPQTRYVLSKALAKGLKPIVVLNKCDREGARIGAVENEILDLFVALDANEDQLDFPIVYASAREGWTAPSAQPADRRDMAHLLDVIAQAVPPPVVLLEGADLPDGGAAAREGGAAASPVPSSLFRMLVSQMDYDTFMGKLLIGRVVSGVVVPGDPIVAFDREGAKLEESRVTKLFARRGGGVVPLQRAEAGDIIQLAGLSKPLPSATVAAPAVTRPLFADPIDPPTISMTFGVNDSPLGGREGSKLTSSMIAERLAKEAQTNVALQVGAAAVVEGMPDATEVRARGELQLSILIESMRREGFELSVSPPVVLLRTNAAGEQEEPYEHVVIDVDEVHSGMVIERMASRKAVMDEFTPQGDKMRLTFKAPSRGLIGFQSELKTESRGTATMHRVFDAYGPYIRGLDRKPRAVMVSNSSGQITAYALDGLQSRGVLFVSPGQATYMGHIVGECSRDSAYDMDVNVTRAKKLTNVRAAGHDDAIRLPPPRVFSLEDAIVYVAPDELVEVVPSGLRLRKRVLDENERARRSRTHAKAMKG